MFVAQAPSVTPLRALRFGGSTTLPRAAGEENRRIRFHRGKTRRCVDAILAQSMAGRHCRESFRRLTLPDENRTGEAMRRLVTMIFAAAATLSLSPAGAAGIPDNWTEVAAGPMFTVKAPRGTPSERTRIGD